LEEKKIRCAQPPPKKKMKLNFNAIRGEGTTCALKPKHMPEESSHHMATDMPTTHPNR